MIFLHYANGSVSSPFSRKQINWLCLFLSHPTGTLLNYSAA